jgi:hypothetical protein
MMLGKLCNGGLCALIATVAFSCSASKDGASEVDLVPVEAVAQDIRGGALTCSEPAVGLVHAPRDVNNPPPCLPNPNGKTTATCTATLVAPDMIVTAAHCFEFKSGSVPAGTAGFSFEINATTSPPSCGTAKTYAIKNYHSFGSCSQPQADDVAVAQLDRPVRTVVASPITFFWGARPPAGLPVWTYGHGCFGNLATDPTKSVLNWTLDTSSGNTRTLPTDTSPGTICPGDSGGPTNTVNAIFWVTSGFFQNQRNVIVFGEVWRLSSSIQWQMEQWTCPGGTKWYNMPVSKDERYPFARHCGMDNQNYECVHSLRNWRAVGGTCGTTGMCNCPNGAALGGIRVPADQWCGATICGNDHFVYTCTSSGWGRTTQQNCGY